MARSLTRRRHRKYARPERLFRRAGVGGNEPVVGYQAALNPSDAAQYFEDAETRLSLVSDGVTALVEATNVSPADEPGARSNAYTTEDVDAASVPGDVGLT